MEPEALEEAEEAEDREVMVQVVTVTGPASATPGLAARQDTAALLEREVRAVTAAAEAMLET